MLFSAMAVQVETVAVIYTINDTKRRIRSNYPTMQSTENKIVPITIILTIEFITEISFRLIKETIS